MRRSRDEEDDEEPVAILALVKEHLPTTSGAYLLCLPATSGAYLLPAVTCYQRCLPALPTSG